MEVSYSKEFNGMRNIINGVLYLEDINSTILKQNIEKLKSIYYQYVIENEELIIASMENYEKKFNQKKFFFPLKSQLKKVIKSGFPTINPFIESLLLVEMTEGVLLGVQDYSCVEGKMSISTAKEGEEFLGMKGKIICQKDELIIRDEKTIIASMFQGPDKKTKITSNSKDIIFYFFGTPDTTISRLTSSFLRVMKIYENSYKRMECKFLQ